MKIYQKREFISQVKQKFEQIKSRLAERERRLWAATESITIGHGGDVIVQKATGLFRVTEFIGGRMETIYD